MKISIALATSVTLGQTMSDRRCSRVENARANCCRRALAAVFACSVIAIAQVGVTGHWVMPASAQSVPLKSGSERAKIPSHESVRAQAEAIAQVRTQQRAKRIDEALRAAQRGVRRFPDNTQLRFLLGVTLADSGHADKAIATFEALNQDHPELAEPYNNLAVLHAAKGNLDAARAALSAAVRVVPDYSLALENLGDIYLRMAQRSYQNAINATKPTPALQRKLTMATALVSKLVPGQ